MESPLSFTAGELEAQRGEVPCSGSTEARPLTPEVASLCIHLPAPGLGPASTQPGEASHLPQRSVSFFLAVLDLKLQLAGATLCCRAQTSHCSCFSCSKAWSLGLWASIVVAHRLSCPLVYGNLS